MIALVQQGQGFKAITSGIRDKFTKIAIDRALRTSVLVAHGDVMRRVFNEQGATLLNGSNAGRYKVPYLKYRSKFFNRSNKNINFILSGDLSRNFKFERRAYNIYVMGFSEMGGTSNTTNKEKYKHLSNRFGDFVELDNSELDMFEKVFLDSLKD